MRFEHTSVWGFEHALRGMRNPKNSWYKSDSYWDFPEHPDRFIIGEKDMSLSQNLINAGSEHRKFLRQIVVSVDITAPLYWWSEMDTYKVGTTANSTSTMHTIMNEPFTPNLFECEGMRGYKRTVEQRANVIDEDAEEWIEHPKYKNYMVSTQGRVKHLSYLSTNNRRIKERVLSGSLHKDGYIFISICLGNSNYKQVPKHRLVAEAFIDNPNDYPEVNHKDGNKLNNSVENLEWATSSENQNHAIKNKLQPNAVSTYKGKLTKAQRDEIVFKYSTCGISKRELAKEYEVSHTTINSLLNNKYNYGDGYENEFETFLTTLDELNELRDEWLNTKDKEVWKTLIEKLPRNWLQTRTMTMTYENLYAMCSKGQRRFHKLNEWSGIDNPTLTNFISWARTLPYAQQFIFIDEDIKRGEEGRKVE